MNMLIAVGGVVVGTKIELLWLLLLLLFVLLRKRKRKVQRMLMLSVLVQQVPV